MQVRRAPKSVGNNSRFGQAHCRSAAGFRHQRTQPPQISALSQLLQIKLRVRRRQ